MERARTLLQKVSTCHIRQYQRYWRVKGAFYREDIGKIDLIWGNDDLGSSHIIKRREEQNISTEKFLSNLAFVVEKGVFRKKNNRGNFEFLHNDKMVVVAPEYHG